MKDHTQVCAVPCGVAYLSPPQIEAYGGFPQAQVALGVGYICHPDDYRAEAVGAGVCMIQHDFHECGHA